MIKIIFLSMLTICAYSFPDAREEFLEVKERVKRLKNGVTHSQSSKDFKNNKLESFERKFSSIEDLPHLDKEELEKVKVALKQYEDAQAQSDLFLKKTLKE